MEGVRIPPFLQDGVFIWTINQPRCGWLISGCPAWDEMVQLIPNAESALGSYPVRRIAAASSVFKAFRLSAIARLF